MLKSIVSNVVALYLLVGCHVKTFGDARDPMHLDTQLDYENYGDPSESYNKLMDENFQKHMEKMRKIKEQRFMDALIMEAGRHVLYPDEYKTVTLEQDSQNSKFDKIKGQPEYIDLGMNRRYSQRSEATPESQSCPVECFDHKPVCASDGQVYDSPCHMQNANCGFKNITVSDWELCRGKHFLCPAQCLNINDPVCGNDGHLYKNICVMRSKNCGKTIVTRPIKYCLKNKESKVTGPCPEDCPEIYDPVCGTDGVIYYNECFLQMWTCGEDVRALNKEACAKKSDCPERCVPIYDPVCGSDGNIYFNQCKMLLENCGRNIRRMPRAYCRDTKVDETPIRIVKRSDSQ